MRRWSGRLAAFWVGAAVVGFGCAGKPANPTNPAPVVDAAADARFLPADAPPVAAVDAASDTPTAPADTAPADTPPAPADAIAPPPPNRASVFVHLFEWRWDDIARECELLAAAGYTAVQISPPSEHAVLPDAGHPWWQRYQTVGYDLGRSRSGTRAAFQDMVSRCARQGIAIYADAVINHMAAVTAGEGSNGTRFQKYSYPGLYTPADFHMPACGIAPADYAQNASAVQRCELVGLADLDTGAAGVRDRIGAYLRDLRRLGVRGFRIDAAKHIAAADLAAIIDRAEADRALPPSYYFLEVIDYGGEAVRAADYLDVGRASGTTVDVTEFKYAGIGSHFLGRNGQTLAQLRTLSPETWQLLPRDRAVVFTNNHDTQRGDAVYYADGPAHDLANVFLLAWPYGRPVIASSFAFDRATAAGRDAGPPSDASGATSSVQSCAADPARATPGTWVCEHRRPAVLGMVKFRKVVDDTPVSAWWDNGRNQIAFARAGRGFVAINRETTPLQQRLVTGLPAGTYCDVINGQATIGPPARCTSAAIIVDSTGQATIDVPGNAARAFHIEARLP